MTGTPDGEQDRALEALTVLSDVAATTADDLSTVSNDLAKMRHRRERGWSWRRIALSGGVSLTSLARILTDLGRASGEFRRALARALRTENMQVTEIALLFEVSRQRVSALVRPRSAR